MEERVVEEKIGRARLIMQMLCDNREPKDVVLNDGGNDLDLMLSALLLPLVTLD